MLGLDDAARKSDILMLQTLLASVYMLATKTRNFHWNVKGKEFQMLHELFGSIYSGLNDQADEIAERIRQLDGTPIGTLNDFADKSFLAESSTLPASCCDMLMALINDSDKVVAQMRLVIPKAEAHKDFGTMDSITKWMQTHEKNLYFLRSHCG